MTTDQPGDSRTFSTLAVQPCAFRGCRKISIIDTSVPEQQVAICVFHFTDMQRFRKLHPVICMNCGTVAYLASILTSVREKPEHAFQLLFIDLCENCGGSADSLHLSAQTGLNRDTGDEPLPRDHHRFQNDEEGE